MWSLIKPKPKVAAGGIAGVLAGVIIWGLGSAGVVIPPEAASTMTLGLTLLFAWLKKEHGVPV